MAQASVYAAKGLDSMVDGTLQVSGVGRFLPAPDAPAESGFGLCLRIPVEMNCPKWFSSPPKYFLPNFRNRPQADRWIFVRKRPLVVILLSYRESKGLVTDRVTCSTWV